MRVLAEIIASDVSLLVTFNHAINAVIQNNPKAGANPKGLATWMDKQFGEREEIIAEMTEAGDNSAGLLQIDQKLCYGLAWTRNEMESDGRGKQPF